MVNVLHSHHLCIEDTYAIRRDEIRHSSIYGLMELHIGIMLKFVHFS